MTWSQVLKTKVRISQVAGRAFKATEVTSMIINAVCHFYLNSTFGRKQNQIVLVLFIGSYRRFQTWLLPSSAFYLAKTYRDSSVSPTLGLLTPGYCVPEGGTALHKGRRWPLPLKLCSGATYISSPEDEGEGGSKCERERSRAGQCWVI